MATPEDRSKPAAAPAPVAAPKAEENPYAQHYVVQKGDTLSKIAEEFYGDKMLYPKIFEANRDILTDPNRIKPGQKLLIP
jgi:nucleoid-associated protein YgaU